MKSKLISFVFVFGALVSIGLTAEAGMFDAVTSVSNKASSAQNKANNVQNKASNAQAAAANARNTATRTAQNPVGAAKSAVSGVQTQATSRVPSTPTIGNRMPASSN